MEASAGPPILILTGSLWDRIPVGKARFQGLRGVDGKVGFNEKS